MLPAADGYYDNGNYDTSVSDCNQACEMADQCTAFAYGSGLGASSTEDSGYCYLYKGGPYRYGDGSPQSRNCYVMPGIHFSLYL